MDYLIQKYDFVNDVILETLFFFLVFKKISCYFEKRCFDAQEVGTQKECDIISCDGKHTKFTLFIHKKDNQYFYCLNRKQLEEYWGCIVKDQEVFCPEKCNNCVVCKFLTKAYNELKSAYFFQLEKICLISLFSGEF